ncbi:MAG TPA: hypothetical protein VJ900_02790 [Patescibacteria group bacterium]|nr:hypothetical protein [Patescibacteria group bacterium]
MSIQVNRKPREAFNTFLRRYSKELRKSGITKRYKNAQYYESKPSKRMQRRETLRGKKKREDNYYKKKTSK